MGWERAKNVKHTLCWDCELAVDPEKCPWVAEGREVPGWWAVKTRIRGNGDFSDSFCVLHCPLFRRDAENGGMKDWKEEESCLEYQPL